MEKSTKLAGAILSGTSLKKNNQLRFWRKAACTGKFVRTGAFLYLQVLDRESVRMVSLWTFSGVIEKQGVFRTQFMTGVKLDTLKQMSAPKSF
jgi:hypothetical protein